MVQPKNLKSKTLEKKEWSNGEFLSGPVVKNLLYNAGESSSIPGLRTKIPVEQLSLHPTTAEPTCHN